MAEQAVGNVSTSASDLAVCSETQERNTAEPPSCEPPWPGSYNTWPQIRRKVNTEKLQHLNLSPRGRLRLFGPGGILACDTGNLNSPEGSEASGDAAERAANLEPLTFDMLTTISPSVLNDMLEERLHAAVFKLCSNIPITITSILMRGGRYECFHMLENPGYLREKVREVIEELKRSEM